MEESKMMQDQDNASESSNSRTEVGERTFGSMDAPSAVGNVGAFSRTLFFTFNIIASHETLEMM